jgi:ribosome-associated toxin RatA of RatAB toxin-antitoxin module
MLRLTTPVTRNHIEKRILKTHPLHLFRIIQAIDLYREFVPFCHDSRIVHHKLVDATSKCLSGCLAKLTVGIPPMFVESYVSDVTVDHEKLRIVALSVDSKYFDSLRSEWTLSGIEPSKSNDNNIPEPVAWSTALELSYRQISRDEHRCHVSFGVSLQVSDPLMIATLDSLLNVVAERQVEAFSQRCHVLPYPNDLDYTPKISN